MEFWAAVVQYDKLHTRVRRKIPAPVVAPCMWNTVIGTSKFGKQPTAVHVTYPCEPISGTLESIVEISTV